MKSYPATGIVLLWECLPINLILCIFYAEECICT